MFTVACSLQGMVQGIMKERHAVHPQGSGHPRHMDNVIRGIGLHVRAGPHSRRMTGQAKSKQESARCGRSEAIFFGTVKLGN